ncbi:MAG: 4-(cytidine 5'-diphospho)-2-C-methyl-D-erythritol kinase [Planctomycetota bacterium]|nr:4-(cytidine 5'-diphospho)-2-C-methyl-D-erythritol kinase [Planctomycetota bacterium]
MTNKEQFNIVHDGLVVLAPAKINLSLLVAGKRPDGFHEIETIMAKVNWFDKIRIERGEKAGIELICEGQHWAPQGRENLVYQACELLFDSCGKSADVKITLTKNIPAGTGLGSASSDAAATLAGVDKYLRLRLSRKKLSELAAKLGSDIAFFFDGPQAFCTGRGEKIKKICKIFDFVALLILPGVSVSTKRVYENYKHETNLYEKLHTRINGFIAKNRVDLVSEMCANMLQTSCFDLHNELAKLKTRIESLGFGQLSLSGSGSSMFLIVDGQDVEKARQYQRKLEEQIGCKSVIVSNNRW